MDRPEMQRSSKEFARCMQAPTRWIQEQLERAVRYLIRAKRLMRGFYSQDMPKEVRVFSDSDHAGCLRMRTSTSSTVLVYGKHMSRSSPTTQGVIPLSSGEPEFYSAVKSSSIGIVAVHMLYDMGVDTKKPLGV
eukprot:1547418-Heterocapsa_arctica.AAC.3